LIVQLRPQGWVCARRRDYGGRPCGPGCGRGSFQLFNLFFITIYQNVILLLICLPAYTAERHRHTRGRSGDIVATVGFLAFLVGETIADQQQ